MSTIKKILPFVFASVIALFLVACGGSSAPADGGSDSAEPGITTTEFQNISGASVTATGAYTGECTFDVTLEDGEGLFCTGLNDEGEWEIVITQDGAELSTDYVYQGASASETGFEPGTYTVTVKANAASGTVNVLAYPYGTIDFMDTEVEEIVATVQAFIDANA